MKNAVAALKGRVRNEFCRWPFSCELAKAIFMGSITFTFEAGGLMDITQLVKHHLGRDSHASQTLDMPKVRDAFQQWPFGRELAAAVQYGNLTVEFAEGEIAYIFTTVGDKLKRSK